jgi:hypothetical protein
METVMETVTDMEINPHDLPVSSFIPHIPVLANFSHPPF